MNTVEELQRKISEYEKRMGIGESDPAKKGYCVLVNILHQQNAYLENFQIKNLISSDDKGKVIEYKNAKDLWENLSGMIEKVNVLKIALKMEGEEKKNVIIPVSATSLEEED